MRTVGLWILAALIVAPVGAETDEERDPAAAAIWIERANRALLPGSSMKARARLTTRDGFGGISVDLLDAVRIRSDGVTRTLIEVEAPEEGQGIVYQIVAQPGQPLERWVWLPSIRRLRRIEGVVRTDHFLGTEFTYEDLGLAFPAERGEGSVRWIESEEEGRLVEVESAPYHYYSRVVTRIDPSTRLPRQVLFYDLAAQLFRVQTFDGVREIDGHPFPTRIRIWNRITEADTALDFETVRFDVEVPLEIFSESVIRRRLAAKPELIPDPSPGGDGE